MIARGVPLLVKMYFLRNLMTTLALFVGEAIASTLFDIYSTLIRIYLLPNEDGNGPMKSIP